MATQAQTIANRRNSSKSTGPRTTEGKAVVARNALKHAFLAHQDLIPGEDREQSEACRRLLLADLAPGGPMESTLAERIVGLSWRLKRADRLQNEVFDYLIAEEITDSLSHYGDELSDADQQAIASKPDTDPHLAVGRAVYKDYTHGEMALDRLMMYERRIENSLYRTMNELYKLRRLREQDGGHRPACETKPMEAAGAVCSVPASACPEPAEGASREETPCGVTTNGAECAKQSQFVTAEGKQRPPDEAAKQSQSQEVPGGAGSEPEAEPLCETKPIEAAEAVCTVPARASREETPCGVTTNGDNDAKQSRSVTVEGGHGPPYKTTNGDAKQSQSATVEGGHSPSCETAKQSQSQEVPGGAGSVPQDEPACETKPIEAAGSVCSVPARASREETPCGVTTNGDGDAKQSQSVTVEAGHSLPSETVKQSESVAADGGHSPSCETDRAKQSQCRQPAAGVRPLLRARPRVAYHYHNTASSY